MSSANSAAAAAATAGKYGCMMLFNLMAFSKALLSSREEAPREAGMFFRGSSQKKLLKLVGENTELMQGCFMVDQLVFQESMWGGKA